MSSKRVVEVGEWYDVFYFESVKYQVQSYNLRTRVMRISFRFSYDTPASNCFWNELIQSLDFSLYPTLNFLFDFIAQNKVLSRQTSFHFLSLSYLCSYLQPISPLYIVLTVLDKLISLTYNFFNLFFHLSVLRLCCGEKGLLSFPISIFALDVTFNS